MLGWGLHSYSSEDEKKVVSMQKNQTCHKGHKACSGEGTTSLRKTMADPLQARADDTRGIQRTWVTYGNKGVPYS
jgi:hypothetical protein